MTVDWMYFTPRPSLLGGMLIGLASALFILFNGRIAGISGILGGLLRAAPDDRLWRVSFLLGLIGSPLIYAAVAPLPQVRIDAGYSTLVLAGLLVGVGTRYGAGCTSGHGVCGLSRRSPRSLTAVASFMFAGFATVFVLRHVIG